MNAASRQYEATADPVFVFILRAPFLLTHTTNEKINYHVAEDATVTIQFSACLYCQHENNYAICRSIQYQQLYLKMTV